MMWLFAMGCSTPPRNEEKTHGDDRMFRYPGGGESLGRTCVKRLWVSVSRTIYSFAEGTFFAV